MPYISRLHFSFSGHCSCHVLAQSTGKSLVRDIISSENTLLRALSPLGLFCGQMKDETEVIIFLLFLQVLHLLYDAIFPFKKLCFKNADNKTRCCILISIPLKLQWVKGGRNAPWGFNQSSLPACKSFIVQGKKIQPNQKHTTIKCKRGKKQTKKKKLKDLHLETWSSTLTKKNYKSSVLLRNYPVLF